MNPLLSNGLPFHPRPIPGAPLGAEVEGFDLRHFDASSVPAFLQALAGAGVMVFRDQNLSADDLTAFAKKLGPLERHVLKQFAKPSHPDIFVISNLSEDGKPIGSTVDGFGWHTDLGYLTTPTATTILYGLEVPTEGGDTWFCSTEQAFAALPAHEREPLQDLLSRQSYLHLYVRRYLTKGQAGKPPPLPPEVRAGLPDIHHPLVRRHPLTGELSLYLGGNSLAGFVGLNGHEGQDLADKLFAHCTEERFIYRHTWRPRDLVLWDNRGTMHTATAYDEERERRLVWRMSVRGEVPLAGFDAADASPHAPGQTEALDKAAA